MKPHAIIRKALAVVEPVFRLDFRDGLHGIPHWSRVWYHGRRVNGGVKGSQLAAA